MQWWCQCAVAGLRRFSSKPTAASKKVNPNLSPNLAAYLASLNCRRRQKIRRKLNSPRLKPIQPSPSQIRAAFESILDADAEFRFLTRARHFLAAQPSSSLPLPLAGKLHRELGFPRGRKLATHALRHPILFSLTPSPNPTITLTPLMSSLLHKQQSIFDSTMHRRAVSVTKLLMMTKHRRLPLAKLHHCRLLFGLPDDFRDRVAHYPHLFRVVVDPDNRHVLELAHWDPKLAVSTLEKQFVTNETGVRRMFRFTIPHSRCLGLDEDGDRRMRSVTTFPLVSPYSDGWKFDLWTIEAEKYRVGLIHEFLSLTLEKRAMIHHIVEFKEELSLTKHTYQMLLKQPHAFYLAGTEMNWAVFLRDAYREDGILIEKDPLVVFEETLRRYACMSEKDFEMELAEGRVEV